MNIKSILTMAAVTLFSLGAYAYPEIGTRAEYTGTVTLADGSSLPYAKSLEVTAFDETLKEWVITEEVSIDQTKSTDTDDADEKDLFTPDMYKMIAQSCLTAGGVLEKITVAAGEFDTCKMTSTYMDEDVQESTEVWWGDVPFGIVKKISHDDGQVISYELSAYK